jgi:S1-C subfamily serine protease
MLPSVEQREHQEASRMDAYEFSESLAAAVERAGASTVTVDARGRIPATGIVWSADGHILTAEHVVQREENLEVRLADGSSHAAAIVGRDPSSDLALLKVEAGGLAVPEWADSLKVGQLVYALGRPTTLQATLGSVVALGGPERAGRRSLEAYIQSDVTMYPGFSGGPLIDLRGRVAGLNSSALARGASLALPVQVLRGLAGALERDGRIRRGFLGVTTQLVPLAEALARDLDQATGLMVIATEKDGPAERAGLLQGDVVVGLGGQAVAEIDDLQAALGPETVGRAVPVRLVRGGQVREVEVTIGVRG